MTEPGHHFLIHFDRLTSEDGAAVHPTDSANPTPVPAIYIPKPFAIGITDIAKKASAHATTTRQKVGADELMQIVAAAQGITDAGLAKKFTGLELTDRLSGTRLADLTSKLPGDKSRLAFMLIADQSIFLPPLADEISTDAAPNAVTERQMLVKVANYVNATVRQLPNLAAMRFSNGFEDQQGKKNLIASDSRPFMICLFTGSEASRCR